MKRFFLTLVAFAMLYSAFAQTENPRGVYKLQSLVDKNGQLIDSPFDQYKVCSDSITLMVVMVQNTFRITRNDSMPFDYTGEAPDPQSPHKTRIYNSNAEHFTQKWWSQTPNHLYFPEKEWCTENYVANQFSPMAKILFDVLMTPPSSEVDKRAPLYGYWGIVNKFDDLKIAKKYVRAMKKAKLENTVRDARAINILTPEHMLVFGTGNIYPVFSDGKTYFSNVNGSLTAQRLSITWLGPDDIAVKLNINDKVQYELWHRMRGDISPINYVARMYLGL